MTYQALHGLILVIKFIIFSYHRQQTWSKKQFSLTHIPHKKMTEKETTKKSIIRFRRMYGKFWQKRWIHTKITGQRVLHHFSPGEDTTSARPSVDVFVGLRHLLCPLATLRPSGTRADIPAFVDTFSAVQDLPSTCSSADQHRWRRVIGTEGLITSMLAHSDPTLSYKESGT